MKKQKIVTVISMIMALALVFVSCTSGGETNTDPVSPSVTGEATQAPVTEADMPEAPQEIKIGFLKGPTGMGAAYLLDKNEAGTTKAKYTVSLES